ncbi:MAG: hypothetical protein H7829_01110 [Magnetococcus sp. THC-1_WYH]
MVDVAADGEGVLWQDWGGYCKKKGLLFALFSGDFPQLATALPGLFPADVFFAGIPV